MYNKETDKLARSFTRDTGKSRQGPGSAIGRDWMVKGVRNEISLGALPPLLVHLVAFFLPVVPD